MGVYFKMGGYRLLVQWQLFLRPIYLSFDRIVNFIWILGQANMVGSLDAILIY
jgi:hypothetical protein